MAAVSAQIEKKTKFANAKGDAKKTPTTDKNTSSFMVKGGGTVYTSEVNPTTFLPDDSKNTDAKMPDYYRNGKIITKQKVLRDGRTVDVPYYSPAPELVGERPSPVLSSIRMINPAAAGGNGPSAKADKKSSLIPEFSKYLLEGVQESHSEKYQVVQTFNDYYVYFYGQNPPVYSFRGYLLNFNNYNWKNEFMYFYENFWRGTKCVELGAKIYLTYDYQQIQGYILNVSTSVDAMTDKAAPFNINVLVTRRLFFNGTKDDGIIRDNLIPRSDTGLINTAANDSSKALTSEFLKGNAPAKKDEIAKAGNANQGVRLTTDSAGSTVQKLLPNPGATNPFSSQSVGGQRANFLKDTLAIR